MSNDQSFSKAYEELQALTQEFESGSLDLELAIPKFKKAAELAKFLKKRLVELENQIEEINLELENETEPAPLPDPAETAEESQDIPF
jgi:exodeoxyribonuclease VII small subunit